MSADTVVEATKVRRRPRWVTWAAAVLLLAGLVTLGWFWRHPTAFPESGGFGIGHDDLPLNTPMYFGMSYQAPGASGEITIHSARANVVRDSAESRIELFVCTIEASADVGGIGAVYEAEAKRSCSSLVPAEGATLELNADLLQQLVIAVSLTEPGQVEVQGIDLNYSHGWQRGTQRMGGDVDVRHPGR